MQQSMELAAQNLRIAIRNLAELAEGVQLLIDAGEDTTEIRQIISNTQVRIDKWKAALAARGIEIPE